MLRLSSLPVFLTVFAVPVLSARQLTNAPYHHILTNINAWSPDAQWLVYDVRSPNGEFDGSRIERVNVISGQVEVLYTAPAGSHCGVVTWNPRRDLSQLVFIQGPEPETDDWNYSFSRRRGVLLSSRNNGHTFVQSPLDAANYAPPFVPGALRGGTHVHVFSGDGRWVSFTYDDNVLAELDAAHESVPHDPNQRNIGVAVPSGPVIVARNHPRNHDGGWFSVLVSRTVADPRPGSDEISKAYEDAWVGAGGYLRADGSRQAKAIAFQGLVTATDGSRHAEVFILDLPDDPTRPGKEPLEGTLTKRPAPPLGVTQRRLTFTDHRAFPGIVQVPRHWLRSSPDGAHIAFLMKDDTGIVQFWLVSPLGGAARQLTHSDKDIGSAFSWSPNGQQLAAVIAGRVCVIDTTSGRIEEVVSSVTRDGTPRGDACLFSPDGRQLAWARSDARGFVQIHVARLESIE